MCFSTCLFLPEVDNFLSSAPCSVWFILKNHTLRAVLLPEDIFIPELNTLSSISEDKYWCPVTAYSAASRDTISCWLVEVV